MQSKKNIGIVLYPFGDNTKGLEQYICESVCAILREASDRLQFTVFVKGDPDISQLPDGTHIVHLPNVFWWKFYLFQWYRKCSTFIFFTESAPLFLWNKSIIVFLDAAYYYFGDSSYIARFKRRVRIWWRTCMFHASRHIVTISYASQNDLIEIFSVNAENISVIYPGFRLLNYIEAERILENKKPYFMYIGPIKERKNVEAIIEAFIQFRKITSLPHELWLVGRKSSDIYETKVNARISASEYKNAILFKTDVSDTELSDVYTHATALVFPSLLEGFGLPILEALSHKCMVITSSTTSTKEVVGEAGIIVDPHKTAEITDAMIRIAHNAYNRELFIKNATVQCAKFSWKHSGNEWNILLATINT